MRNAMVLFFFVLVSSFVLVSCSPNPPAPIPVTYDENLNQLGIDTNLPLERTDLNGDPIGDNPLGATVGALKPSCEIFWMNKDKPARYWPLRDKILLPDDRDCLPELIPTICHELRHREQRFKYGLPVYWFLNFPIWRRWTIEPAAIKRFDDVQKLMELIG